MNTAVEFVRWFNRVCPWNQYKHSLFKRVSRFIDTSSGLAEYSNILGSFRMKLDLDSLFEQWIYMNCYELVTVQLLQRLLKPGDVYVDVGANLGYFVLVASKQVGADGVVYAFEPQPKALDRLNQNLQINDIRNVELVPKGCWHEATTATLHDFSDGHIGEASMSAIANKTVGSTIEIQTVRIDDVVTRPPKVVKLDVEGAEFGALQGAEKSMYGSGHVPHVIIELNPKTCSAFGYEPTDIVDWLYDHHPDYRLHWIKSKRYLPISRSHLQDLLKQDPRKHRNAWFAP